MVVTKIEGMEYFQHLTEEELDLYAPNKNPKKIDFDMRKILNDWIKQVIERFVKSTSSVLYREELEEDRRKIQDFLYNCYYEILDHMLKYLNGYIELVRLQALGAMCLSVAEIFAENLIYYPAELRDYFYVMNNSVDIKILKRMQINILEHTNYSGCQNLVKAKEEEIYGPRPVIKKGEFTTYRPTKKLKLPPILDNEMVDIVCNTIQKIIQQEDTINMDIFLEHLPSTITKSIYLEKVVLIYRKFVEMAQSLTPEIGKKNYNDKMIVALNNHGIS